MKNTLYILLFILIPSYLLSADDSSKEKGILAFNDQFYSSSSRFFTQYRSSIGKNNPDYAEATILLIRSLAQEQKYELAREVLNSYKDTKLLLENASWMQDELSFWDGYLGMIAGNYSQSEGIFQALLLGAIDENLKVKIIASQAEGSFLQKKFQDASNLYFRLADEYGGTQSGRKAMIKIIQIFLLDSKNFYWAERQISRLKEQKDIESELAATWLEIMYLSLKGDMAGALKLFRLQNSFNNRRDSNVFMGAYYLGEVLMRNSN
ncbi:MAG: hypothetical protein ACRC37_08495, partial [Lentisphaeria bacterium]